MASDLVGYFKSDPTALTELKALYTNADSRGLESFVFRDSKMVTQYAGWLIVFLENSGVS